MKPLLPSLVAPVIRRTSDEKKLQTSREVCFTKTFRKIACKENAAAKRMNEMKMPAAEDENFVARDERAKRRERASDRKERGGTRRGYTPVPFIG